jgi:hypothetical protein
MFHARTGNTKKVQNEIHLLHMLESHLSNGRRVTWCSSNNAAIVARVVKHEASPPLCRPVYDWLNPYCRIFRRPLEVGQFLMLDSLLGINLHVFLLNASPVEQVLWSLSAAPLLMKRNVFLF